MTAATGSVNLSLQPTKTQVWKGSCQDPILLGEQASIEKTTQRFQRIATTLADLNAEGLNAQAVNDLLTMYVVCSKSTRATHELCA